MKTKTEISRYRGVRTLAAILLIGTALSSASRAHASETAQSPAQETSVSNFQIPAQPLSIALEKYSDITGVSFAYRTGDFSGLT